MSDIAEFFPDPSIRRTPSAVRFLSLFGVVLLLCAAPFAGVLPLEWSGGLVIVAASILLVMLCILVKGIVADNAARQTLAVVGTVLEQDQCASIIADAQGNVLMANSHATAQLKAQPGVALTGALRAVFANPSSVLFRLQSKAYAQGRMYEDIVTRGGTVPISVSRLRGHLFCWRFYLGEHGQLDQLNIPVLTTGRGGTILHLNPAAERLLNKTVDSLEHLFPHGLPQDGQVCTVSSHDGQVRVVVNTASSSGAVNHLLLVPLDETAEAHDGSSFADLPVPILRLSPEGTILEANRMARTLLGDIQKHDTNISQITQGLGRPVHDWLERTASGADGPRSEFLRLLRDDKDLFVQVTLDRVQINGQVSLIAVLNDATELKTLEAQFVQGQKMQAVGQLAGGVAHDFNNLLTAISGHCDLLLLRHDQSDPNYGDLVQINQNANRAAALVSQLLAFSRKQTLQPEVLDLRDTISDLIHLLNRLVGEKVQLTLSHDPVLQPVRADKRQLEQVLMNLVVNARDAMPEGGEIRIETEVLTLTEQMCRDRATVEPGDYVTVKVIDSGMGIPADKLQKVFEPFYTTKRTGEGTGLGLSTVYGIVKQTGGFIFVDSALGRGTEFTVFLPVCNVSEPTQCQAENVPDTRTARQGEGVVLLVEDEAPVRAFATRALRLKGYTVLEAESAEDALMILEDRNLNVDVFVTDVVMPGMDGPTWVRKAMETRPDVHVVFVSGYTEGAFDESGPQLPNSTFLPKPFSLTQLTEAVFEQMN